MLVKMTVSIPPNFRDALHEAARRSNQTYSEFIRSALVSACAEEGVPVINAMRPVGRPVGFRLKGK